MSRIRLGLWLPIAGIAILVSGCDQQRTELSWSSQLLRVEVTAKPSQGVAGSVMTFLRVMDKITERDRVIVLDDDVAPTHMRLVEFHDWLLVVNGKYVLGGIHRPDLMLIGENHWDQLPFTIWTGQGQVLANGPLHTTEDGPPPAQFPRILMN